METHCLHIYSFPSKEKGAIVYPAEPVHTSLYLGDATFRDTLSSWLILRSNWGLVSEQLMCKFFKCFSQNGISFGY